MYMIYFAYACVYMGIINAMFQNIVIIFLPPPPLL